MTSMDSHRLELDLHQLDLRFAASRLVDPQAVAQIAQSIERCAGDFLALNTRKDDDA